MEKLNKVYCADVEIVSNLPQEMLMRAVQLLENDSGSKFMDWLIEENKKIN